MSDQGGNTGVTKGWMIAAGAGLLVFLLLMAAFGVGFIGAVFIGAVVFVVVGLLMGRSGEASASPTQPVASTAAPASPKPSASAQPEPAERTDVAASEMVEATAPTAADTVIRPSTPLAGEEDLAARKGTWKYEAEAPNDPAPVPENAAPQVEEAAPAVKSDTAEPIIKPSKPLAGEADLASRKGTWRYEAPKQESGVQPEMMDAPREAGPDDLTVIKGIGPKLQKLCHSMGVYHYDQIAAWGPQEVAWMDANLEGFRGRVTRDDWVGQAKALAASAA